MVFGVDEIYQVSVFWIKCIVVDWVIWIVFDMEDRCFGVFCFVIEVVY